MVASLAHWDSLCLSTRGATPAHKNWCQMGLLRTADTSTIKQSKLNVMYMLSKTQNITTHFCWCPSLTLVIIVLWTNTNWCSMPIVLIRITSTFALARRPMRMFCNVNKLSRGPAKRSLFVQCRISSLDIVSIRVVPIGLYHIVVLSYQLVVYSHRHALPGWCDSKCCNTVHNDSYVVLDRTGSY